MKRRPLLLLFVIVLGAIAWWLSHNRTDTTLAAPLTDFAISDTSRVTRIFISDKQGRHVDLQRKSDGWWVDGLYRVRQPEINTALKTFLRIEVKSPVPKSAEAMVLRTMAGSSLQVEIYEGGSEPSKTWIVGHATKDHFGTYMVLEKAGEGRSSAPFVMGLGGFTGILNTRFPATLDNWRSCEVFNFHDLHDLASVEVTHTESPAQSFKIENPPTGLPRLLDKQGHVLPMDTVFVQAALLPYRLFNYEFIDRRLTRTQRDSLLAAPPNFIVSTKSRSGEERTMKLWYMPYTGEEPAFNTPRPLHNPLRMQALVEDSLVVVVQRQYTDLMTQPARAMMP